MHVWSNRRDCDQQAMTTVEAVLAAVGTPGHRLVNVNTIRRVLNLLLEKGRCAAPAATSTLSVRGEAKAEEGLFWDGEIRQTANKHVERGKNGEDGKPVWRLSEIIGDVCLLSQSHLLSFS